MKITVIGRKCTPRDSFKERAEKRLQEKTQGTDIYRAEAALLRAMARINVLR